MTPSEAMRVMENPSDYTVQERKDAKKVIAGVGSLAQDTTAPMKRKMPLPKSKLKKNNMSKGGNATKKVPVISIGVGMAEVKKGKKNYAKGGYANCGASMPATQKSSGSK